MDVVALVIAILAGLITLGAAAAALLAAGGRQAPAAAPPRTGSRPPTETRREASAIIDEARGDALTLREQALDEVSERRLAVDSVNEAVDSQEADLRQRREALDERRGLLDAGRAEVDEARATMDEDRRGIAATLAEAAGLDRDQAADGVLSRISAELEAEHADRVAHAVAVIVADEKATARTRMVEAMERQDASHSDGAPRAAAIVLAGLSEEQRNELLEALSAVAGDTATELQIDAEREQAQLRGLDPVGREVARQASLEVADRRLQAADVHPLLLSTRRSLAHKITDIGERAMWEMQIGGRPELAELVGTLHYRFSYGQNALLHCKETGFLCQVLAAELGMDSATARTAGMLHDIGKAVDHDVEGLHAIIGGDLLEVLGHPADIVLAVKAHHFDVEPTSDLAMLTICADAISASRPGARRDTLTAYLARLEQLQAIATRHTGVDRAFPLQAGREVRVSVRPDTVKDHQVPALCAEIAREIEAEMAYPGMIKVTVVRETTATATAK